MTRSVTLLEVPCSQDEFLAMEPTLQTKLLWVCLELRYYDYLVKNNKKYHGGIFVMFSAAIIQMIILIIAMSVIYG